MVFRKVIVALSAIDVASPIALSLPVEHDLELAWATFIEAGDPITLGPAIVRDGQAVTGYLEFEDLAESEFDGRTIRNIVRPIGVSQTSPHDTLLIDALRLIAESGNLLFFTQLNEITHFLRPAALLESPPLRLLLMTLALELETSLRALATGSLAIELAALLSPHRRRYLEERFRGKISSPDELPAPRTFLEPQREDPWATILREHSSYSDLVSAVCRHARLVDSLDYGDRKTLLHLLHTSIHVRNRVAHGLPVGGHLPSVKHAFEFVIGLQRVIAALPDAQRQCTSGG